MGICENNPEESYFANVQVPMYLAKAAKERKLICFSSDQVYSGCDDDGPYAEENVKPANVMQLINWKWSRGCWILNHQQLC